MKIDLKFEDIYGLQNELAN